MYFLSLIISSITDKVRSFLLKRGLVSSLVHCFFVFVIKQLTPFSFFTCAHFKKVVRCEILGIFCKMNVTTRFHIFIRQKSHRIKTVDKITIITVCTNFPKHLKSVPCVAWLLNLKWDRLIETYKSCSILLGFSIFFQLFCPGLYEQTNFWP